MDCHEIFFAHGIHSCDIINAILCGTWRFYSIWVSLRYYSSRCNYSNFNFWYIFYCWKWINPIKYRHWILCLKFFLFNFLKKHFNCTLRTSSFIEIVNSYISFNITFSSWRSYFFFVYHLLCKNSYLFHSIFHLCGWYFCFYYIQILLEHINTRIFFIHSSYNRDVKFI